MGLIPLAFGFVFVASGIAMLAQARKTSDESRSRNSRFAGSMMMFAGAAFFIAAAIPLFGD